ncbi:hypothetical protein [Flavisolibacter nicotianae]|nr:hypothetical protein [Flavisolibacter nicotianae]
MKLTIKNPLPTRLRFYVRQLFLVCLFLSLLALTLYVLINSPA